MCIRDRVADVDVIPDAGAVGGVVVIPVDFEAGQFPQGHLGNIREQVVGDAVGVLPQQPGGVGAYGVEIPHQGNPPAAVRSCQIGENLLDVHLGHPVGVGRTQGEVLPERGDVYKRQVWCPVKE